VTGLGRLARDLCAVRVRVDAASRDGGSNSRSNTLGLTGRFRGDNPGGIALFRPRQPGPIREDLSDVHRHGVVFPKTELSSAPEVAEG
jgi:hypothetical protein